VGGRENKEKKKKKKKKKKRKRKRKRKKTKIKLTPDSESVFLLSSTGSDIVLKNFIEI
jgi:hypothetical protein